MVKSTSYTGHGTFRILVLAFSVIGDLEVGEQEQKLNVIFYVERIGCRSPVVNKFSELTLAHLSVSDTNFAQGERLPFV